MRTIDYSNPTVDDHVHVTDQLVAELTPSQLVDLYTASIWFTDKAFHNFKITSIWVVIAEKVRREMIERMDG